MVDVSLTESLTIIPTYPDGLRSVVLRAITSSVWLETITECPRVSLTESLTSITYLSIKI